MDNKLHDTLIGFGDFEIGAPASVTSRVTPPARGALPAGKATAKVPPKGKFKPSNIAKNKRPYPKGKVNNDVVKQGKVLQGARATATKTALAIGVAHRLISKTPLKVVAKPGVSALATKRNILMSRTHVGAAAVKALTPKQQAAVKKHKEAVEKANAASKVLAAQMVKARAAVKILAQKMVAQKKISKGIRLPKRGTHVGALLADTEIGAAVMEAFEDYYTQVGASPDPANPGYLDDGSPDPAFGDMSADMDMGPMTEDPFDSGVEMPESPPMDQPIMDALNPDVGAIIYDGSKGTPEGFVLSYKLATRESDWDTGRPSNAFADGVLHPGYVFGRYDLDDSKAKGIWKGSNLASQQWNQIVWGAGLGGEWFKVVSPAEAHQGSIANGYGPIVGNPAMPEFAKLRSDTKGRLFWLPQDAPDWVTFPLRQAAAITAKAEAEARAAEEKLRQATEAKQRADEEEAQRQQDAANALAETQAASQARIAEQAAETQAQQALVDQQKADTAQQTVDMEQAKQAGDMMLAEAKRQQEYLAQHPEVEFAPPGDEEPADAEESTLESDTLDMEDGERMPGADVMDDADGEGFEEGDEE